MTLTADQIVDSVLALAPEAGGYWVAFSGGLDSQVLLHALAARRERLPAPLAALHVNHNLQADAPAWAEHCRAVCAALDVSYRLLSVAARPDAGESPEAAARVARYRALAGALPPGAALLTAHHRDDQAETLLLQLIRGAGPKGLAAMPAVAELDNALGAVPARNPERPVRLLRPLLEYSRDDLHAYAREQGLQWIDDPSNARTDYDRNYLRHEILPRLRARWPAVNATLGRAAAHQAEAAALLEDLAALDVQTVAGAWPGSLSVSALLRLSAPRRANLLRHWLHRSGVPVPAGAVLARIAPDVLRAAPDAEPLLAWPGARLRRYRDLLLLDDLHEEEDPSRCLEWDMSQALTLPGGVLRAEPAHGAGVARRHFADGRCQVRFRQGGERLRPAGRREHHTLKHLFQEAGVPPWERMRVPLIHRGDSLIAVAGYWVCEGFQAADDEPGVRFVWSRAIVPAGSFW
ncbi:MAG: tRNA lysidine(34) synthetase TilS [Gammaproteobacteria bacterium]